jgi:hypothetical protein
VGEIAGGHGGEGAAAGALVGGARARKNRMSCSVNRLPPARRRSSSSQGATQS